MRVRFADLELDSDRRELLRAGDVVELQPKVFDLLLFLVGARARLVTRQELLDAVWDGTIVGDAAISRAIREVRRAVGDDGEAQKIIKTVHARGFRFVAEVRAASEAIAPSSREGFLEPIPPSIASDDFIGRTAAIRQLDASITEVLLQGAGRTVIVSGEAGIGKTFLAERVTRLAATRGLSVHVARCSEADGVPALWPWEQLVRSLAAIADRSVPALREAAADIAPLLGSDGFVDASSRKEDAQSRFRLYDGCVRFITEIAKARPLALMIDDLHLADDGSLALLRNLVPRLRSHPVALVVTMRDPVATVGGATTITLEGLEPSEVAELFERQTGTPPDPKTADSLQQWTGGNPLFLSHLMRITEDAGEGSRSARLPRVLRDAVAQTLEVLSEEARRALEMAAVVGGEFRLLVVAKAMSSSSADLLDGIGEALEHRIIRRVPQRIDTFSFVHGVLRDALYADLGLGERGRRHALVGDALASVYGASKEQHAEELAHHFLRAASTGRADEAVRYATLAADHASARAAFDHAATLYRAALDALPLATGSADQRGRILIRLGSALGRDGRLAEAGAVFREAAASDDTRAGDPAPFVRDVAALRDSFERIVKRAPEVTTHFYDRLFASHPDLRALFHRNSPKAQSKMMNDTLMAIIDRLEDAPWLRSSLAALGARHVEYGVTEEMYPRVGSALLATLAEAAGPEVWTPAVSAAWSQAFDAITAMMLEGARARRYSAA